MEIKKAKTLKCVTTENEGIKENELGGLDI